MKFVHIPHRHSWPLSCIVSPVLFRRCSCATFVMTATFWRPPENVMGYFIIILKDGCKKSFTWSYPLFSFRFISAAANKDVVTLTPPYLDPLGAGFIVSISHSLKTKFNNKRSLEKLFGVVGGDLAVSSLGAILAKKIGTNCKNAGMRCFLMDNSGYIVYHPNFENVFNDSSKVRPRQSL